MRYTAGLPALALADRWFQPLGIAEKRFYIGPIHGVNDGRGAKGTVYGQVKLSQASCAVTIHVPADVIWYVISDFGAACEYLDMVVNCTVEDEGVGARRTLTYVDGSTIVERLETLNEATWRLSYALLTDSPFGNCLTTMAVRALEPYQQAELVWSASFQPVGIPASEAVALLESALAANCLSLKQFLER